MLRKSTDMVDEFIDGLTDEELEELDRDGDGEEKALSVEEFCKRQGFHLRYSRLSLIKNCYLTMVHPQVPLSCKIKSLKPFFKLLINPVIVE